MAQKTALITGITGQDGSYLAEFLLAKGYRVVGMTRRTSTDVHERIEHVVGSVEILSGDLLDQSSMTNIIAAVQPDEVYNLAAQSFVPASWTQPVLTGEFTALGVTRILEAIRAVNPRIKFYQASSSEMFGKVQQTPQTEATPFYPRSPYGVAKVYGHWITVNYRESFDMFATSGILFNHESIFHNSPVIIKHGNLVDIIPIGELLKVKERGESSQDFTVYGVKVWDGDDFVDVLGGTAYKHRPVVDNKDVRRVEARCGTVTLTGDHVVFLDGEERPARAVGPGDMLKMGALPPSPSYTSIGLDAAWMLGAFVGDGSAWRQRNGRLGARFTNSDRRLREYFAGAWERVTCGRATYQATTSGFVPGKVVGALALSGAPTYIEWLRDECYTAEGHKRIPRVILNADEGVWRAFLEGYNATDGLTAAETGYRYKNFKTNSPVLAMGLWWLSAVALKQDAILSVDVGPEERPGPFYSMNLRSPNPVDGKGAHLRRDRREVKRVVEEPHFDGWLYDITTSSGKFMAGVGQCVIHNSPRRGKEFVTRKISDGVARIKLGLATDLRLGNLDAQRDWGFAGDYVRAMWLMLQQATPDDFVVATGRTHSVRDFAKLAFAAADLDYERYVVLDPRFVRPAEVDLLIGDPSKAKAVLGWEPEVSFEQLVEMMVRADLERLRPVAGGL